jgi:hypothetical protein
MNEYTIVWHTDALLYNVTKAFGSLAEAQTWAEGYAPAYCQHWHLESGRVVNEARVRACFNQECYGEVHDDSPCSNCGG